MSLSRQGTGWNATYDSRVRELQSNRWMGSQHVDSVVAQATHPSMPHCPPPPQCDPTDEILVAPLEPGIADVGLVFLERVLANVNPAVLAAPGTLARSEGARTTIVGYGTTSPRPRDVAPDAWPWDGKRRIRVSAVRRIVDETWGFWPHTEVNVRFGNTQAAAFSLPRRPTAQRADSLPTSAMAARTAAAITTTIVWTHAQFRSGSTIP